MCTHGTFRPNPGEVKYFLSPIPFRVQFIVHTKLFDIDCVYLFFVNITVEVERERSKTPSVSGKSECNACVHVASCNCCIV